MAVAVPYIAYALMAAGAVTAGYASYSSGQAQMAQYKLRARQEKTAARDREIYRKQELLKALALRSVAQGASGTTMSGTPNELVVNDFRNYEMDRSRGYANDAALQASLDMAGRNASTIGKIQFAGSLFSAAGSYYSGTSGLGKVNTPGTGQVGSGTVLSGGAPYGSSILGP